MRKDALKYTIRATLPRKNIICISHLIDIFSSYFAFTVLPVYTPIVNQTLLSIYLFSNVTLMNKNDYSLILICNLLVTSVI